MKNKIISLILISGILFSLGGLSGCGNGGEKPIDTSVLLPEEITGMLTAENLSVAQNGVSFTVEEGAVLQDTDVKITLKKGLPPIIAEDEEIILTAYDFSVLGEEPVGVMKLEIPCVAKAEEVFAAYFNLESNEWEPVEFTYDEERKCAVIYTTHLSSYGVFTIKNENKRTAMLAYSDNLNLIDMNLTKAIEMLEDSFDDPDTFYADSFNLISNSVAIHSGITTNLVDVMSGLSTSYVPAFSEGLKGNVTKFGYLLTGIEVVEAFMNDDKPAGVWKMLDTAIGFNLDKITSLSGTASMAAGLFSVGVVNYVLNEFITTAWEGRTDIYAKAYNLYYKEKGRKTADWVLLIRGMVEKGKDPQETAKAISAEINRYVYEFWQDQTTVGVYGQAANPGAWSTGSLGGLNDKIKKEISEANRADMERIVSNILNRIQVENKIKMQSELRKELLNFQKKMNSVVNINVRDSKAENKPSYFAGAILRFTELPAHIEDPEKWESKISEKGEAKIQFRVLAHLLAGSPRKMEIVKKEGDKEVLMVRFNAKFSLPDSKLNLADLYPKSYPKNIGGSYRVSMYNTTTQKTIDDLVLKVNITKEVADGCYADFYLENQGSVYLNGNYFYRYSTGKVNYALGEMSFADGGNNSVTFKFDAYDNQKNVWGSFTGHK